MTTLRVVEGAHPVDEPVPVLAGHLDVGDEHVGTPCADGVECLRGRAADPHDGAGGDEDRRGELERLRIVVDDEHAKTGEQHARARRVDARRVDARAVIAGRIRRQRQHHDERRSASFARALRAHAAAVELDQMLDER